MITPREGDEQPAEEAEPASPFAGLDKPCVVFVADFAPTDSEQIQEVVFKNEKIGLAMKAFNAYWMKTDAAEVDPIIGGEGKELPRLLVVDPAKEKVRVLEGGKIKVSNLYKEMKTASGRFYKENLDTLVKGHLKILTEQDQLANEIKVLQDKRARAEEKGEKAKRDIEEIDAELAKVNKELEKIKEKEKELWTLTPKSTPA